MRDYSGTDLAAQDHSLLVMKKPVPVSVRFAPEAGVVQTLEGPVRHVGGDALLTGQSGDQWPVARARFLSTYAPMPPALPGEEGRYKKQPLRVRALQAPEDFMVKTGENILRGSAGDWLVQYGPDEYGVVAADIFARTYMIL